MMVVGYIRNQWIALESKIQAMTVTRPAGRASLQRASYENQEIFVEATK